MLFKWMARNLMTLGCLHGQANASIDHFVYHLFWVFSPSIQWCLGCDQTFQFAPYALQHNHPKYPHLKKVTQLVCLEFTRCLGSKFGKEVFKPLLPSMMPLAPSLKILN
jgi:hypothetical protein